MVMEVLAIVAKWRYWLDSSEEGSGNGVLAHCAVMVTTMMMENWHQQQLKSQKH